VVEEVLPEAAEARVNLTEFTAVVVVVVVVVL
jgi:hypothetical protein